MIQVPIKVELSLNNGRCFSTSRFNNELLTLGIYTRVNPRCIYSYVRYSISTLLANAEYASEFYEGQHTGRWLSFVRLSVLDHKYVVGLWDLLHVYFPNSCFPLSCLSYWNKHVTRVFSVSIKLMGATWLVFSSRVSLMNFVYVPNCFFRSLLFFSYY